jgi:hypothetical protein
MAAADSFGQFPKKDKYLDPSLILLPKPPNIFYNF